jgi:hypothetical protein
MYNFDIKDSADLDEAAEFVEWAIIHAYEASCPELTRSSKRDVPWWNPKLDRMRSFVRSLQNKRTAGGRAMFKRALTAYNKEVRSSKRRSWKNFCAEVGNLTAVSKLRKVLSKGHSNGLGTLRRSDGSVTDNEKETLKLLMSTHFPGSYETNQNDRHIPETSLSHINHLGPTESFQHFFKEVPQLYCQYLPIFLDGATP